MKLLVACFFCLTPFLAEETTSMKLSSFIQNTRERFAVQVIYEASDIVDQNGREFDIFGEVDRLNLDQRLRLISQVYGLELEKLNNNTFVLSHRASKLEQRVEENSRRIRLLEKRLAEFRESVSDLLSNARSQAGTIQEMENDLSRLEAEMLTLRLSEFR